MKAKAPTRGIPTRYREGHFRSRLEARWAAFFDLIEWTWVYEPLDEHGWIPDFLVQGPAPFLVEVGPCILQSDYFEKAAKAVATGRLTLVLGTGPLPLDGDECGLSTVPTTEFARWAWCEDCYRVGVYRDDDYTIRPCGHGGIADDTPISFVPERTLMDQWSAAGSRTQWRGRRAA